jgi:hypothetical protein
MALNPIQTSDDVPPLEDGRKRTIGQPLRTWLKAVVGNHGQAIAQLSNAHTIFQVPYGVTVTPNLYQGGVQKIVVTNGSNFTIAAPINPMQLAEWTLVIVNASGGSLGAATFNAAIQQTGYAAPVNGHRTSAVFLIEKVGSAYVSTQKTPWQVV